MDRPRPLPSIRECSSRERRKNGSKTRLSDSAGMPGPSSITPAGGHVRGGGEAGAGDWCVAVIDDGPGIPAESLKRVFEPFFRLSRDEHSRIEGNGLGLSICRELIEKLHGEILLED